MRSERENGGPAFPIPCQDDRDCSPRFESGYGGMSLRRYAAIKLRVPDSGTDWLDNMIKQSLRTGLAAKAMQGLLASGNEDLLDAEVVRVSYRMADAMLAARERS